MSSLDLKNRIRNLLKPLTLETTNKILMAFMKGSYENNQDYLFEPLVADEIGQMLHVIEITGGDLNNVFNSIQRNNEEEKKQ